MNNLGIDIVGLLNWADGQRAEAKRMAKGTEPRDRKPPVMPEAMDLIGFLQKRRQENAMIDAFFKDLEKANKKEPDKKKGLSKLDELSATQLAFLLMVSFPLYVWVSLKLLGH